MYLSLDVYSSLWLLSYSLLNVFCTRNIMTCILDNAGHVIITTSGARVARFYFDHEEEGSNLILLLHHYVPLRVIAISLLSDVTVIC